MSLFLGYWWMCPVSVAVATAAMTFGIGGAVLFSPIFIVFFPLFDVPVLTPADAIGAALMTELVGFSSGLVGYQWRKLIDYRTGGELCLMSVPLAVTGTLAKSLVAGPVLVLLFAAGMFLLCAFVYSHRARVKPPTPGDDDGEAMSDGGDSEAQMDGVADVEDGRSGAVHAHVTATNYGSSALAPSGPQYGSTVGHNPAFGHAAAIRHATLPQGTGSAARANVSGPASAPVLATAAAGDSDVVPRVAGSGPVSASAAPARTRSTGLSLEQEGPRAELQRGCLWRFFFGTTVRVLVDRQGKKYRYKVGRPPLPLALVLGGSFLTGLISVGIGETVISMLRSACKLPMRVAAATSVFVVTVTVLSSAATDIVAHGIDSVPWTLVMWTMPGVLIGGQIGPYVSSKVSSYYGERALVCLFLFLGCVMGAIGTKEAIDKWG